MNNFLASEPFDRLVNQIEDVSRHAPAVLAFMRDECGMETAYYAAFVLVCFEASLQQLPGKPPGSYSAEDFRDFTFFEKAQGDARALALFDDLLRVYQADRQSA